MVESSRRRIGTVGGVVLAGLLAGAAGAGRAADACAQPLGRVVSVQGEVQLLRGAQSMRTELDATLCAGDQLRVPPRGRAAVVLANETMVRLDQGSTLTLGAPTADDASPLGFCSGAIYVITRTPRRFKVRTPFMNASVDGTEFFVEVARAAAPTSCTPGDTPTLQASAPAEGARITVVEGRVRADNLLGTAALENGQSWTDRSAPGATLTVRPQDAVTWTLHVPTVLDAQSDAQARQPARSQGLLASLAADEAAADAGTAASRTRRAGWLLLLGRVADGRALLQAVVDEPGVPAPVAADALALLATVAVAENRAGEANVLADRALATSPASAGAWIARSYAQQAQFEIEPALASVRQAIGLAPNSALGHLRRAELELSLGRLDAALAAARVAVDLNPNIARTQSVLGFVQIARLETAAARASFGRAIELDQADALPHLGLGLARVRGGDLPGGRREIEVAALLDPAAPLVRSYLGKAYYEEGRGALAADQLAIARSLDPRDPTPHFYDAVRELAIGNPVAAVRGLEESIALNDSRAVYRSRLLLDQDHAARMVSLARAYRALGFDQLAGLEAVKSLSLDPGDPSGHRFLADSYAGRVKSEAARLGELLQAQLRQPLGLNTVQPQFLADRQLAVEGSGPVQPGSYEFTPLFDRNQLSFKADALAGGFRTIGDQLFLSGLQDTLAYSVGQFHAESDGYRPNNDLRHDLANAFLQAAVSPGLRLQAEYREERLRQGDLSLRFDPDDFSPTAREDVHRRNLRLGALGELAPGSTLALSWVRASAADKTYSAANPAAGVDFKQTLQAHEVQLMHRAEGVHVTLGASLHSVRSTLADPADPAGPFGFDDKRRSAYALVALTSLPLGLRPQVGYTWDAITDVDGRRRRGSPAFGLLWQATPDTTLRLVGFKTVKHDVIANQTLQPAQMLGFGKYYDDPNGTISKRRGAALDHAMRPGAFVGVESSTRDLAVPAFPGDPPDRWTEKFTRAYLYGMATADIALTAELQSERLRRPQINPGNEGFTRLNTRFVPLGMRVQPHAAWAGWVRVTAVDQLVQREDASGTLVTDSARYALADASLTYLLPRRGGSLSLEVKNLFDRRVRYQEIDVYSSPRISPRRLVLFRAAMAF